MSELRLNFVTREWVIIASERAKRPHDFAASVEDRPTVAEYLAECPFCPGNEAKTPPESLRVDGGKGAGGKDGCPWRLRVVPNKFAALSPDGEKIRIRSGVTSQVSGIGRHEVIVETPLHNLSPAHLELSHVEEILRTYKSRFLDAYSDPLIEHVIIFRNHGARAGTSLEHPHSQLIATPVVPIQFRDRVQAAMHYFDDTGSCLICDIMESEREEEVRVVTDTEHFLTFIPYAALSPFHTWIFPKRHNATFADITDAETTDLAFHLRTVLAKLYKGLGDPHYNYVIRSSRPRDSGNEYCHWYISLIPRLTMIAGFELGSGMYISTSIPEEAAEFLRDVKV